MKFNFAQKFFLGVTMLTPSALRQAVQDNISQAGTALTAEVFAQALLKAAYDGGLGAQVANTLVNSIRPIDMTNQLADAELVQLLLIFGSLNSGDVSNLYELYRCHVDEPLGPLLDLVGYGGGTSCPKSKSLIQIFEGLAFQDFETESHSIAHLGVSGAAAGQPV